MSSLKSGGPASSSPPQSSPQSRSRYNGLQGYPTTFGDPVKVRCQTRSSQASEPHPAGAAKPPPPSSCQRTAGTCVPEAKAVSRPLSIFSPLPAGLPHAGLDLQQPLGQPYIFTFAFDVWSRIRSDEDALAYLRILSSMATRACRAGIHYVCKSCAFQHCLVLNLDFLVVRMVRKVHHQAPTDGRMKLPSTVATC